MNAKRKFRGLLRKLSKLAPWVSILIALSWTLGALPEVGAAIPNYINFQGKLTDSSSNPVSDGSYAVTFRIYAAETGGSALWTETQTVTVASGVFNAALGTTTDLDLDFDVPYWLSIQVTGDVEMSPRQRLTAAGYALNTQKLDTYTSGQFLRSDANDTASGQLMLTYPGTALVVQPSSAPDSATNLIELKDTAGSSKFSVNYAGNTTAQNATVGGTLSVAGEATLNGDIKVTGRIRQGSLGDTAEMMKLASLTGDESIRAEKPLWQRPQPADVVVIDRDGGIRRSFRPFSTNVAGIVSTNPAQVLRDDLKDAVPVALNGIVPCKVTSENGLIKPGDILVSSSTPGYAMRAGKNPPAGTVIGKALSPLKEAKGIIDVIVMMK